MEKKGFSCRKPPVHPRLGSTRLWISDQIRRSKTDKLVKSSAAALADMVKEKYNLQENWSYDYTLDLAEFVVNKLRSTPPDKRREYDDHPFPLPDRKDLLLRVVYMVGRSFALVVQVACKVKHPWWSYEFADDLAQLVIIKFQSSTTPLDDADALPSKKKRKSIHEVS